MAKRPKSFKKKCSNCQKTYQSKSGYENHKCKGFTGYCERCEKTFVTRGRFKGHACRKPLKYKCNYPDCTSNFRTQKGLSRHLSFHRDRYCKQCQTKIPSKDVKAYTYFKGDHGCPMCKKHFNNSSMMSRPSLWKSLPVESPLWRT